MTECTNEFALEVLKKIGATDEELVFLGSSFSESNVKLQMYLAHLKKNKFITAWKHVEIVFASKGDLEQGSAGWTWGMDHPDYKKFTNGKEGANGRIPCMAIGGKVYWDSAPILKMLFEKYEASSASDEVKTAFNELYELSMEHEDNYYTLLKHFGWCAMNGHKENYKAAINMSEDEIKQKMKSLTALLSAVEKKTKGGVDFIIDNKLSVVDMLCLHWPASAYQVVSYPVSTKYPNAWAWYKKMCANPPEGSDKYLNGDFAFFSKIIWVLNISRIFGGSHYIGNDKYH